MLFLKMIDEIDEEEGHENCEGQLALMSWGKIKNWGRGKKKVGAGIGATPTWGYCVCCY